LTGSDFIRIYQFQSDIYRGFKRLDGKSGTREMKGEEEEGAIIMLLLATAREMLQLAGKGDGCSTYPLAHLAPAHTNIRDLHQTLKYILKYSLAPFLSPIPMLVFQPQHGVYFLF
jgi:hypothetical protein